MAKRKLIDWESVEPLYRAGNLSNCEICRQYEADHKNSQTWKATVSEKAIRNQAKKKKWQKNLADKVKKQVRENLVRTEVRGSDKDTLSDQEIIEKASQIPTEVRQLQRVRAQKLAATGDKLQKKLDVAINDNPPETIEEATAKEATKDMSLSTMVNIFDRLVTARMRLQQMESNAFGLDEIGDNDIDGITVEYVTAK